MATDWVEQHGGAYHMQPEAAASVGNGFNLKFFGLLQWDLFSQAGRIVQREMLEPVILCVKLISPLT